MQLYCKFLRETYQTPEVELDFISTKATNLKLTDDEYFPSLLDTSIHRL